MRIEFNPLQSDVFMHAWAATSVGHVASLCFRGLWHQGSQLQQSSHTQKSCRVCRHDPGARKQNAANTATPRGRPARNASKAHLTPRSQQQPAPVSSSYATSTAPHSCPLGALDHTDHSPAPQSARCQTVGGLQHTWPASKPRAIDSARPAATGRSTRHSQRLPQSAGRARSDIQSFAVHDGFGADEWADAGFADIAYGRSAPSAPQLGAASGFNFDSHDDFLDGLTGLPAADSELGTAPNGGDDAFCGRHGDHFGWAANGMPWASLNAPLPAASDLLLGSDAPSRHRQSGSAGRNSYDASRAPAGDMFAAQALHRSWSAQNPTCGPRTALEHTTSGTGAPATAQSAWGHAHADCHATAAPRQAAIGSAKVPHLALDIKQEPGEFSGNAGPVSPAVRHARTVRALSLQHRCSLHPAQCASSQTTLQRFRVQGSCSLLRLQQCLYLCLAIESNTHILRVQMSAVQMRDGGASMPCASPSATYTRSMPPSMLPTILERRPTLMRTTSLEELRTWQGYAGLAGDCGDEGPAPGSPALSAPPQAAAQSLPSSPKRHSPERSAFDGFQGPALLSSSPFERVRDAPSGDNGSGTEDDGCGVPASGMHLHAFTDLGAHHDSVRSHASPHEGLVGASTSCPALRQPSASQRAKPVLSNTMRTRAFEQSALRSFSGPLHSDHSAGGASFDDNDLPQRPSSGCGQPFGSAPAPSALPFCSGALRMSASAALGGDGAGARIDRDARTSAHPSQTLPAAMWEDMRDSMPLLPPFEAEDGMDAFAGFGATAGTGASQRSLQAVDESDLLRKPSDPMPSLWLPGDGDDSAARCVLARRSSVGGASGAAVCESPGRSGKLASARGVPPPSCLGSEADDVDERGALASSASGAQPPLRRLRSVCHGSASGVGSSGGGGLRQPQHAGAMFNSGRSIAAEWLQVPAVPLLPGTQCHDDAMVPEATGWARRHAGSHRAIGGRSRSVASRNLSRSSLCVPPDVPKLPVASSRASDCSEWFASQRDGGGVSSARGHAYTARGAAHFLESVEDGFGHARDSEAGDGRNSDERSR